MTQIAIKGHATRGEEIIKILEMLGGINLHDYNADCDSLCYYSEKSTDRISYIYYDWVNNCYEDMHVFTLEEFLEKYPYKIGDKVTVTGLPEYPKIINFMEWFDGNIHYSFDNETWFLPSALNLYKEETMEVKRMAFAIAGHKTRGKEVIEILEMLGGNNPDKLIANFDYLGYFIGKETRNIYLFHLQGFDSQNVIIFTLEEFLEKFPYKVGDRVSSKYLKNYKIEKMEWENTDNRVIYKLQGMGWYSADELQPYKEETMDKVNKAIFDSNAQCCDISNRLIKEETMEENLTIQDIRDNNAEWLLNKLEGMSAKKALQTISDLYDKLRKPKYPKTYVECINMFNSTVEAIDYKKIRDLNELIYCRNTYWKIAGEQMGLGKLWEPNWSNDLSKYYISFYNNKVDKGVISYSNKILAFPTEEMRDAFYENFKGLIESCKELL